MGIPCKFINKWTLNATKVTNEEMDGIPHYMIDILNPDDSFSVYDFKLRAQALIEDITSRGKIPIIAGGTGLYIQSLIYDYPLMMRQFQKKSNRKHSYNYKN